MDVPVERTQVVVLQNVRRAVGNGHPKPTGAMLMSRCDKRAAAFLANQVAIVHQAKQRLVRGHSAYAHQRGDFRLAGKFCSGEKGSGLDEGQYAFAYLGVIGNDRCLF